MAQECGFFNAQPVGENEYDRVYLAEQFAAYFASFIGNGIFGKSMQKLEVLAQTSPDMSVKVLPGEAWINGWWYRNSEEYILPLDIADGVLKRIDLVVLRWGNQERDMWLHIIKGVPSKNPVAPDISRDADYYDLQLAAITVDKGAIKITQANISDTRLESNLCGLVTGVVDQIDTTGLYNQFEQYFAEFKEYYEQDYADWTEAQKAAYLAYIENQQALYEDWISQKQSDYETWTADKMADYIEWITTSKQSYEAWIDTQQQDFIEWALSHKEEYENWTSEQKAEYLEWITKQQLDFREWYDTHTQTWTSKFDTWFANIKDKLSSDVAGSLQLQIDEQQKLIDNLYDILYSGTVNAPMLSDDGTYIKASDGSYIISGQSITGGLQEQVRQNTLAIEHIMSVLQNQQTTT